MDSCETEITEYKLEQIEDIIKLALYNEIDKKDVIGFLICRIHVSEQQAYEYYEKYSSNFKNDLVDYFTVLVRSASLFKRMGII